MSESNSDIIDIPPENVVEHKAEEKEPPQAAPPARASRPAVQFGVAALLVVAAIIAGGWVYRDFLSSYFPSDAMRGLTQRIDALDSANKELAQKLEAVVGVTDEIKSQASGAQSAADMLGKQITTLKEAGAANAKSMAALETTLNDAQAHLTALDNKLQNMPTQAGVSSTETPVFEQRLAALEKDVTMLKAGGGGSIDKAALSQTLADLKGKIAEGSGFADELGRIQRSVPAADGLDVLARYASSGVANTKTLQMELRAAVAQLPKPVVPTQSKDTSWIGWMAGLFDDVISIRDQGQTDWPILAQKADAFLAAGDLAQANGLFDNLPVMLPDGLKQWHDRASARLALEQAFEKTSAAVLRQIAARG